MNKSFTILLAASLFLVAMPFVAADEAHPDCEDGQKFITYPGDGEPMDTVGDASPVFVCEGEHWDGQDTVSDEPAKDDQPCLNDIQGETHVSFCQSAAAGEEESDAVAGRPVTFRVSTDGEAAYVALNIDQLGQVIAHADGDLVAVYVEDGSALNVLAIAVSSLGITKGYVSEADCDQEQYGKVAEIDDENDPDYRNCGRDNTAITVILP